MGRRGSPEVNVVAFAAAVVVLIGALAVTAALTAERALDRQTERRAEESASLAAGLVGEQLQRLGEIVGAFAGRPSLRQELAAGGPRVATEQLRALRDAGDGIALAFLADPGGRVLNVVPFDGAFVGRRLADGDWFEGVTRVRSPYVSRVHHIAAFDRPRAVVVAARVEDGRGNLVALLCAAETSAVQALVEGSARVQGIRLRVHDQAGVLVAESGRPAAELVSRRAVPGVAAGIAGRATSGRSDGLVHAFAPLARLGWVVEAELPLASVAAEKRQIRTTMLALALVVAAAAAAAAVLFLRRLRELEAFRRARERSRQALELNDDVIQHLTVAQVAYDLGDGEAGREALGEGIDEARRIVAELLGETGAGGEQSLRRLEPERPPE